MSFFKRVNSHYKKSSIAGRLRQMLRPFFQGFAAIVEMSFSLIKSPHGAQRRRLVPKQKVKHRRVITKRFPSQDRHHRAAEIVEGPLRDSAAAIGFEPLVEPDLRPTEIRRMDANRQTSAHRGTVRPRGSAWRRRARRGLRRSAVCDGRCCFSSWTAAARWSAVILAGDLVPAQGSNLHSFAPVSNKS